MEWLWEREWERFRGMGVDLGGAAMEMVVGEGEGAFGGMGADPGGLPWNGCATPTPSNTPTPTPTP
jgi:hypothetical protein